MFCSVYAVYQNSACLLEETSPSVTIVGNCKWISIYNTVGANCSKSLHSKRQYHRNCVLCIDIVNINVLFVYKVIIIWLDVLPSFYT